MNYFRSFTQYLSKLNNSRNGMIVASIGTSITSVFLYKLYSVYSPNLRLIVDINTTYNFLKNAFVTSLCNFKRITSQYSIFNNMSKHGENSENGENGENGENNKHLIPYEQTYYKLFSQMDDEELDEDYVKLLKNNIIYEMTPRGRVALYYDYEKETFNYYCDTKDIPYKYLEAVAHKYAITYDCKNLVVDMKKELEKSIHQSKAKQHKMVSILKSGSNKDEENRDATTSRVKKTVSIDNNMYVSYKQYNRKGSGGNIVPNKKAFVTKNNSNRYSYLGKMNEFSFLQTNKYSTKIGAGEVLDYAAFKKLTGKK